MPALRYIPPVVANQDRPDSDNNKAILPELQIHDMGTGEKVNVKNTRGNESCNSGQNESGEEV